MQAPPEQLGSFYLGAAYDLDAREVTDTPITYDARDLTTHAVCVGMTGSGKTGLCIGLLEEAALDKVPAILIDPKGDITNLLLQFPDLKPEDFQPWINADDARRKGKTVDEFAGSTAEMWRNGLNDWGITSERIRAVNETTNYTVFTPGSDAGVPISILGSLAAPGLDFDTYTEAVRDRISGTVAALLGLIDINADPVRSREAILLSNIFEHFWKQNEDLDLAKLIMSIQNPPVRQLGVFDVDTFYPEKDRFQLAMSFNNLMASPSFQSWLQGEALDIASLFYTEAGQPRHSIFYIAHLSDSERMFFVTLLLENLLTWVRRQTGTTSLRALLYFDEIFGFFPPTAEPPSKRPLLTLLKQARAFGLGVVLVTQNPVDIDYKGLTNAGTWFIGKLQAERDKDRVLSGLKGAIAEAGNDSSRIDYDALISRLGSRVFLMHNVHDDGPVVMHTRWVHSYLRGPMTRPQVRQLMAGRSKPPAALPSHGAMPASPVAEPIHSDNAAPAGTTSRGAVAEITSLELPAAPIVPEGYLAVRPTLDPKVEQVFVPITLGDGQAIRTLEKEGARISKLVNVQLLYEPAILGMAGVNFMDRKRSIDEKTERALLAPAPSGFGGVEWEEAEDLQIRLRDLEPEPQRVDAEQGPFFAAAPEAVNSARELSAISKDLSDWLYHNVRLALQTHEELDIFQKPGEREREFKVRLQQAARERRDDEVDKLEAKFEKAIDKIEDSLTKEERELDADRTDFQARRTQEWVSIGESVVSYFIGRRSTRAFSSAMSKRRMTANAQQDIRESEEEIEELKKEIHELNDEFKEQAEEITVKWANMLDELTAIEVKPRRTDVNVELVALAWLPSWYIRYDDGVRERTATFAAYDLPHS